MVAGFTKKGFTAFLGTMSGLFVTALLTFLFGGTFKIDGMNQPFAQSVLFASSMRINILDIFYSAIVIGASGAAMDIAMDMSATIEELKYHNPTLTRRQLIKSGFNVGRSVIGTGFTKKGFTAFLGTMSGLFVTALLTFLFGGTFKIDGMNQPFAQSVLFASSMRINILDIFYSAIVIGASGAAMDIAMDMSATIEELKYHNPTLTRRQLIKSGFNVGRSVIGTMTTTLLLAYSGGFLTLMILFLERDTTLLQILNMKIVTSEIIKIIIGSIGLTVVAPMTTYIGSYIYSFLERDTTLLQILNMKIVTSEIIKIIIGSIGLTVVAPMTTYIGSYIYSLNCSPKEK